MKVRRLRLENMTVIERTWCLENNLSETGGLMKPRFQQCFANRDKPGNTDRVYLCMEGNSIVGWALYFKDTGYYRDNRHHAYFFVPDRHRRKGYGRALTEAVLKDDNRAVFHPWGGETNPSTPFFRQMEKLRA